jgi:hypothetical protein
MGCALSAPADRAIGRPGILGQPEWYGKTYAPDGMNGLLGGFVEPAPNVFLLFSERRKGMVKSVLTVLGCAAALALATSARADVGTVTPLEVTNIQALSGDQVPGAVIYNNTTSSGFYYPPPDGAVPVELGTAVVVTNGSIWHVNNFSFGYATKTLDDGSGPIEVIINFYASLASDDSPDTTTDPVASFDIPNLPGSPDGTTIAGWLVGPVDLTAPGLDFDWAASTFAFDGTTKGNWVTIQYQQTTTGPILASGETILNAFWSGKDILNPPYNPGSFFYNFGGQAPPAFYLQIGGTAQ